MQKFCKCPDGGTDLGRPDRIRKFAPKGFGYSRRKMSDRFQELVEVERMAAQLRARKPGSIRLKVDVLDEIACGSSRFPIYAFELGSPDPEAPVLAFFGGVHGLERIGSQVVISYLGNVIERVDWDESLHWLLERVRLLVLPIVNPGGMHLHRRSNPRGVDLMRNAPVDSLESTWLLGGQRITRHLPWYRGEQDQLERESEALCKWVEARSFESRFALWIDVHSGFGRVDRFWFPYAKSRDPFPRLPEVMALKRLLDRAYPHHVYRLEPQALNYVTHGDLWDYLFDRQRELKGESGGLMLPFTLEMGSWAWVRKNPWQLFSFAGPFNPIKPHRQRRVLRRHLILMDFLLRAAASHERWLPSSEGIERSELEREARGLWYPGIRV